MEQLEKELSKRPAQEPNDTTALTREQQEKLNQHKVKARIENEQYLRKHPEIAAMVSSFVSETLLRRPENIRTFASEYFTDPALPDKVKDSKIQRHAD